MPDYDLEILGQKFNYPKVWPATVALIGIVAGVIILIYMLAHTPTERLRFFIAQVYEHNGTPSSGGDLKHVKLVQFWTPTEETKNFLKDTSGNIVDTEKWEQVSAQQVSDFDQKIAGRKDVDGYRRYQVFGHGRTRFKPGWWWVMTVRDDFKVDDFIKEYSQFWKNPNSVYIEELVSDPKYLSGSQ